MFRISHAAWKVSNLLSAAPLSSQVPLSYYRAQADSTLPRCINQSDSGVADLHCPFTAFGGLKISSVTTCETVERAAASPPPRAGYSAAIDSAENSAASSHGASATARGRCMSEEYTKIGAERAWQLPPAPVHARSDEVHVWRASLRHKPSDTAALRGLVSADELEKLGEQL